MKSYKHWIKIPIFWEMSKRGRSDQSGINETMSGRRTLNIKDKYFYKQT